MQKIHDLNDAMFLDFCFLHGCQKGLCSLITHPDVTVISSHMMTHLTERSVPQTTSRRSGAPCCCCWEHKHLMALQRPLLLTSGNCSRPEGLVLLGFLTSRGRSLLHQATHLQHHHRLIGKGRKCSPTGRMKTLNTILPLSNASRWLVGGPRTTGLFILFPSLPAKQGQLVIPLKLAKENKYQPIGFPR